MTAKRSWRDVPVEEAYAYKLPHPGIQGPVDSEGDECPWPWYPLTLAGKPIGMTHCAYCGDMVVAGVPHPDYADVDYSEVTG